jgi:hypothetical protein
VILRAAIGSARILFHLHRAVEVASRRDLLYLIALLLPLSSPTLTWGTGATVSDNLLTGDAAVAPSLHRVTLSFATVGLSGEEDALVGWADGVTRYSASAPRGAEGFPKTKASHLQRATHLCRPMMALLLRFRKE